MEKRDFFDTTATLKTKKVEKRTLKITKQGTLFALRCTAFLIFGLLLGTKKLLFDTVPLGFALLAASAAEAPAVLLGIIAASFEGAKFSPSILIGACVLLLSRTFSSLLLDKNKNTTSDGTRTLWNSLEAVYSENVNLRVMSAAIGVFFCSVWRIVEGGFRFYDLFASFFYLVLTPIATILFSLYFTVNAEKQKMGETFSITPTRERLFNLSKLILLTSLVLSLDGISLVGVSVPLFCALFITLYICKRGILYGLVAGLLLGVAVAPPYAPMLAFCALAYCSVYKLSIFGGGLFACIAGLVFGIYVRGVSTLALDLPALLCASMVYCSAERLDLFSEIERAIKIEKSTQTDVFSPEILIANRRISNQDEKLRSISDSFSSLSEIFYNLSTRLKRPSALDLRSICEDSFNAVCSKCENYELCFGAEYAKTLDIMKRATVQLHSSGLADEKKLPESFKQRCPNRTELIENINKSCAIATKKAFRNEKTEIFALDYDAISSILNDAISENEEEFKIDYKMSKKISRAIAEEGYGEHNVMVFGKRKLKIFARGLDLSQKTGNISSLKARLEAITELKLSEPSFELSYGSVNMQTEAERAFSADCAFALSTKEGESICGDSVSIFENKNDYLYALISDGMGTGNVAALASEICNTFLRNMLTAGNRMESAIRMLNSLLRVKGERSEDECSATIDLLQLDLYSGALTLVKSGAAPTLVLRRSNVFKLSSPSFPIGILRAYDAKQINITCEDGDVIVMISDGAFLDGASTEADGCDYIAELLKNESIADESAQKIADRILRRANSMRKENDLNGDDISVVVVKVKKEICGW